MAVVLTMDPKSFVFVFGVKPLDGYAADKFSLEYDEDGFSEEVGCEGDTLQVVSNNKNAIATINLLAGHPDNEYLSSMYNNNLKVPGSGNLPAAIRDINGNTRFSSAKAWVKRIPGPQTGKNPGAISWQIRMTDVDGVNGTSFI